MFKCFSAPKTPIEDSVVGFQVDKLVNGIRGESRIKITVYEHDQGQVSGNAYFINQLTKQLIHYKASY